MERFKLTSENNPLPFPLPVEVQVEESVAYPGTQLDLRAYEHPNGPFSSGVWVSHMAVVVSVGPRAFNVSYERGFESTGQLRELRIRFI